ncbi:hypothetical protein EV702DRAFT_1155018 [Suillus placidus]|uniref:Uncharacterized protein n=1 Tax=Suillus placidus TaxID=48579 RepID=A0A9P7CVX8_9AGAM|nr:hypothetical protein EV702DRAFT_1155018 [Suillus placidus]
MPATRKVVPRKCTQLYNEDSEPDFLHSEALDDLPPKTRTAHASPSKPKPKRRKCKAKEDDVKDEKDVDGSDVDLKEGQQVVGRVVQAPKSGWAPPGRVSLNTLDFLAQLKDPARNDREWFALLSRPSFIYQLVYRCVENEFKDFIEAFTNMLTDVDSQIPPLPPKDVIHRIYRDVRFSNDKTPYKKRLSASFLRSGRKGIFAFFKPGDESVIAAGAMVNHPLRSTLATKTLHTILASKAFTTHFGPPRPHLHGDHELKVAPKGVHKNHKDIALLKCRSLAVSCRFKDAQVVTPGSQFMDTLRGIAGMMTPFVHCLNDLMTLPVDDSSDEENEDDDTGGPQEDESEDGDE